MNQTLQALKFVQGAIADSALAPELSHFLIKDNSVIGYNGHLLLSSPIDISETIAPKAKPFVRAIEQCEDAIEIRLTESGNLRIISGSFTAIVPTISTDALAGTNNNNGRHIYVNETFYKAIETLRPFMGHETWSSGILFLSGFAYATNNFVLCRVNSFIDSDIWFNLPDFAIKEMLRIKEPPDLITIHEDRRGITIRYPGGRLLKCVLGSTEWPNLNKIFNLLDLSASGMPVDNVINAANKLKHFLDVEHIVYITENVVSTTLDIKNDGAAINIATNANGTSAFNYDELIKLADIGAQINFAPYPGPVPFWNSEAGILGAIVGMQL